MPLIAAEVPEMICLSDCMGMSAERAAMRGQGIEGTSRGSNVMSGVLYRTAPML